MAISVTQVRTAIGDNGLVYPPATISPEIIGVADGVKTVFVTASSVYVPGQITVYTWTNPAPGSTTPPVLSTAPPSSYSVSGQNITFGVAPANGLIIAVRYVRTGFSDAELADMIQQALNDGCSSDSQTLAYVQRAVIVALLLNTERLKTVHYERFMVDYKGLVANLEKMYVRLEAEVKGAVIPGGDAPALLIGGFSTQQPYQPPRA